MEHEPHHQHHAHGTGIRWLDMTLAIAAAIVSLVSLWLGLHSAHSMEKLVAANSYPYLDLGRSTHALSPDGIKPSLPKVEYELANNGVGPARVEWVQFFFKGQPQANLSALVEACCADAPGGLNGMHARGSVAASLIRPGSKLILFSQTSPRGASPAFDALHRQMNDISFSACYCSVFNECYFRKDDETPPEPVDECKAPKVSFRPGFH